MPRPRRLARRHFFGQALGGAAALSVAAPSASQERAVSPMSAASLAELDTAVKSVLAAKRVGEPVFVRLTLLAPLAEKDVLPSLSRFVQLAGEWLGQPLDKIFAVGTAESGQVSVALTFRQGASALASVARSPGPAGGVDLMLLGNRGAVYHEAAGGWDTVSLGSEPIDTRLLNGVQRALRSGKAEAIGGGAQP